MKSSVRKALWIGFKASGGFFVSTFLFGVLFGAAATYAGIESWQILLMSATVFSASAQFAALEFWLSPLPLFTITLSVGLVSARNILLGMSLAHHLDGNSMVKRLVCLSIMTDPAVVTMFDQKRSLDRLAYMTGYGLALLTSWLLSTAVGLTMAEQVAGLDLSALAFAGPLVMATMMMLMARGMTRQLPSWLLSGVVAIMLLELDVPAWAIMPAAVLAGASMTVIREQRHAD